MIDWAAIYPDLTVFTNRDGPWADAPAWGMQAVVYRSRETGWSVATGNLVAGDEFIARLPDGAFTPLNVIGLVDRDANVLRNLKVGRYLSREEYAAVIRLAQKIMRGEKTGYFKNERRQ